MGVETGLHSTSRTAGVGHLAAAAASARARGDQAGEEQALRAILAIDPRNLGALLAMGELLALGGDRRGAQSHFSVALQLATAAGGASLALHGRLEAARSYVARVRAEFADELRSQLERSGLRRGSVSRRVAESLDLLFGRTPLFVQQPTMFYLPGLAQRPFFDRDQFDWLGDFETALPRIQDDLAALIDHGAFSPHVVGNPRLPPPNSALLDDPRWSACHLWRRGREQVQNTALVPATVAALNIPPIPKIPNVAPMIMFSLLRSGTHIASHHGVTNTRLICHLPLVTPDDAAIRVGSVVRPFEVGKTILFDDSFEHEAWNRGTSDRVVLLFEIWRPDIGEAERAELATLFELVELGDGSEGDS